MSSVNRIPLNTFAISFGLTGLAEVWSTAAIRLGASPVVGEAIWVAALLALAWLVVAHTVAGSRTPDTLIQQLRHPVQGPVAAIVPVVIMLMGAHLASIARVPGVAVVVIGIGAGTMYAAWTLSRWFRGNAAMLSVHGGFLIPTVALGFVGSYASAQAGMTELAIAYFGIGVFFWIAMVTIVIARHFAEAALPEALMPTLGILLAPPVVAGLSWFTINHSKIDGISLAIAGVAGLVVLVQLALVPAYASLPFTLGFWSFTFPASAAVVYIIEWLAITAPPAWQVVSWVLVAVITALTTAIAARSLRLVRLRRGKVPTSRAFATNP
jgi:tellurite resistance protein